MQIRVDERIALLKSIEVSVLDAQFTRNFIQSTIQNASSLDIQVKTRDSAFLGDYSDA
ncbi:hypothetical protein HNQ77_001487 [Silvibacterium bohemicum]|uniref:Uncharacterized protein n=1 Tax=Silvibacterium bohemicum TaxID=1577686 RepID=A0A841JYM8_9BACT|nr:hypothetical protein [Silvibacterium bohemicum]MBB6143538.1 hypothetical protein [Silvibacterium bohemicum]